MNNVSQSQVLGSGMNLHLSSNSMVREIFELPPPLPAQSQQGGARLHAVVRGQVLLEAGLVLVLAVITQEAL